MAKAAEKKKALAKRIVDSTTISGKRDKVHHEVMKRFGTYKPERAEELRAQLKPAFKSVERHAAKEIKMGGRHAVANVKGKNNYMNHLTDRARRRGESD